MKDLGKVRIGTVKKRERNPGPLPPRTSTDSPHPRAAQAWLRGRDKTEYPEP